MRVEPLEPGLRIEEEPAAAPPPPAVLERVEALWQAERAASAAVLWNGRLFSARTVAPGLLRGAFVEYRWWVAQRRDPSLRAALAVRPVGVTGIARTAEGLLFGRRSQRAHLEAGLWELLPSGGLDDGARGPGGAVDAAGQLLRELEEEANLSAASVTAVTPRYAVRDAEDAEGDPGEPGAGEGSAARGGLRTGVVELAFALELDVAPDALRRRFAARPDVLGEPEYSALEVVAPADVPAFAAERRGGVSPVTLALLRAEGLLGPADDRPSPAAG